MSETGRGNEGLTQSGLSGINVTRQRLSDFILILTDVVLIVRRRIVVAG